MKSKVTRTIEAIDAEIAQLKVERTALVAANHATATPGKCDKISVGMTGRLVTLTGIEIVGTNECTTGTFKVRSAKRQANGKLVLNPAFEPIEWANAATMVNEHGEVQFVTVDGDIVPESQVKLVA